MTTTARAARRSERSTKCKFDLGHAARSWSIALGLTRMEGDLQHALPHPVGSTDRRDRHSASSGLDSNERVGGRHDSGWLEG